ncbi:MAG: hypothetical protein ABH865_06035 [Candidatus Omnitrophota bacterium]|nr:general secretion pathway protein GspK [Candidatus Omnitrophota bacterium]
MNLHFRRAASILILVLWSLVLLAVFAVIAGYSVRQKLTVLKRLSQRQDARFLNEAAINKGIFEVQRAREKTYFFLKKHAPETMEPEVDIRSDSPGQKEYRFKVVTGISESKLSVFDEERKININIAPMEHLKRLCMVTLGTDIMVAQELAASIVDWRDTDSMLSIPLGSAEDSFYRSFPYSYEAKDGPFEVLEELLLVKGVTQEVFEKIKKYITIYGDGKINVNTASGEVLASLGIDRSVVERIMVFRAGGDGVVGTGDDGVIASPLDLGPVLRAPQNRLSEAHIKQYELIADQYLTTQARFFTLDASSRIRETVTGRTVCVVDRSGNVVYWSES